MTTDEEIFKMCLELLEAIDDKKKTRIQLAKKRIWALRLAFDTNRIDVQWNKAVEFHLMFVSSGYLLVAQDLGIEQRDAMDGYNAA